MRTLALEARSAAAHGRFVPAARIGPNAIIQLGIAVARRLGDEARADLFRRAGLARYLVALPDEMVAEGEVIALHRALRETVPADQAREVSFEAGVLTGHYILANRIPRPAQFVLKLLPRALAVRALTAAIAKHAWTFAGSGTFRAPSINPLILEIGNSPLSSGETSATPLCAYYAGTFTALYRALVDPQMEITESTCGAVSGGVCRFTSRRVH